MADDLLELKERVRFAADSANALGDDIRLFLSESIEHWQEVWADAFAIQARLIKPIPVSIRSRAGMIVNELRSILDALACHLAERNGKTSAGTYFPISKTEAIFKSDGYHKIRKLSDEDKSKISALEPYWGGHPYLFKLHEADRVKKHQKLLACGGKGELSLIGPGRIGTVMTGHEEGIFSEIGKDITIAVYKDVTTGIRVTFHVIYAEPDALAGESVIALLAHFCPTVWEIISLFD